MQRRAGHTASGFPSVRLRGLWLEQFGFAVGSKLQITARAGELVVTVVER